MKDSSHNEASLRSRLPYRRIGLVSTSLAVLITAGIANYTYDDQVDQTHLNDIAKRPKDSPSQIGGLTQYVGNMPSSVDIDNRLCADIVAYTETPAIRDNPTPEIARAIGVLAHEYSHIGLGVTDESQAGCYSVQLSSELAQGMNATHDEAVLLRERVAELFTPLVSPDANPYIAPYGITSDCVPGGAYDIDSLGNAFPPQGTALS